MYRCSHLRESEGCFSYGSHTFPVLKVNFLKRELVQSNLLITVYIASPLHMKETVAGELPT